MANQDLIVVKQLPIIQEQLKTLSEEIDNKVETAKKLVCTEETVKTVKQVRADLNKEFKELEEKRKFVKEQVLAPYMQFEEVYKQYVSDKYKSADTELKSKVDNIENELKAQKEKEVREYFEEYRKYKNIDFIKFEQANIKVGLSDSKTSLHKQAQAFIDKTYEDLNLINTQEHKAEMLVEYKQSLNVSQAITTVTNRFKAIEEEKRKQEELKQRQLEEAQRIANENIKEQAEVTKQALDNLTQKEEINQVVLQAPIEEQKQEEVLTLRFTVKGTRTKLKALKEFLENGGYDYE